MVNLLAYGGSMLTSLGLRISPSSFFRFLRIGNFSNVDFMAVVAGEFYK